MRLPKDFRTILSPLQIIKINGASPYLSTLPLALHLLPQARVRQLSRCLGSRHCRCEKASALSPVGSRTCKPPGHIRPERLEKGILTSHHLVKRREFSLRRGNCLIGGAHLAGKPRIFHSNFLEVSGGASAWRHRITLSQRCQTVSSRLPTLFLVVVVAVVVVRGHQPVSQCSNQRWGFSGRFAFCAWLLQLS